MQKIIVLTIICFIVYMGGCSSKNIFDSGCIRGYTSDANDPFHLLKTADCFRIGPIGYGADTSPEKIALVKIMNQSDSYVVLEKLFYQASPAGQLYALAGLRLVDKTKYEKLLMQIKHRNREISSQLGCIVQEEPIGNIVEDIERGEFDADIQQEFQR